MSKKLKGKAKANARKKAKKTNQRIGDMMTLIMPDGREQDISMSDMMAEMRVHNKVNVKEVNGIHHVSSSLAESPSKTMAFCEMLMSKYS
jgi:hypothetical protein